MNFKNNLNLSKEELLENKISKDDIGSIANDLNQQKVTQIETPTEILVNPKSENSNSNSIEISKNYRSDEFTKSEGFNIHEILKDKLNDQNKFEFTIYKFTSYFVNPTIKLLEENQDLNIRPEISLKLKNLNLLTHSFVEINSQSTLNIQLVLCSKCFKFAFYESFSQNFLNIINDNNYFEFSLLNKLLTNTILKYLTSFKQRSEKPKIVLCNMCNKPQCYNCIMKCISKNKNVHERVLSIILNNDKHWKFNTIKLSRKEAINILTLIKSSQKVNLFWLDCNEEIDQECGKQILNLIYFNNKIKQFSIYETSIPQALQEKIVKCFKSCKNKLRILISQFQGNDSFFKRNELSCYISLLHDSNPFSSSSLRLSKY